jgi:hypothetical protein
VIVDEETIIERCDGRRAIATISSHPVYNSNGEVLAGVVTVSDVTELRRMQEAEGRRIAAEKVAEATRSLISNCSHELRTVRRARGGGRGCEVLRPRLQGQGDVYSCPVLLLLSTAPTLCSPWLVFWA